MHLEATAGTLIFGMRNIWNACKYDIADAGTDYSAAAALAATADAIPLPPQWVKMPADRAIGSGGWTDHRLPVCNQQTLAELEAQGVPRQVASIMARLACSLTCSLPPQALSFRHRPYWGASCMSSQHQSQHETRK